ncbi:MAG: pyridoxal 5'-phosphate synthase glutaminase subunit PdxT [Candidatus Geothermincolales bacterium]
MLQSKKPTVGVLALQGAVREHIRSLEDCGARGVAVKYPSELCLCEGFVIPGGESTTIGRLMREYGFIEEIKRLAGEGMPIYGTCAGLILMAQRLTEGEQPLLGLMDITVRRNAYGRQVDSFETDLRVKGIQDEERPFRAVFIRAPWIEEVGKEVEVLAVHRGKVVAAKQENLLVTAFHPELTSDGRVHMLFLRMVMEGGPPSRHKDPDAIREEISSVEGGIKR